MSSLMEYLPSSAVNAKFDVESDQPLTANSVLSQVKIPQELVQVVMVNGEFLPPESRDHPLNNGDALTVWPSIQGG